MRRFVDFSRYGKLCPSTQSQKLKKLVKKILPKEIEEKKKIIELS